MIRLIGLIALIVAPSGILADNHTFVIHPAVGDTIDAREAKLYGLFRSIPNFEWATYSEISPGRYQIKISSHDENGIQKIEANGMTDLGIRFVHQKIENPQPLVVQRPSRKETPRYQVAPASSSMEHPVVGAIEVAGRFAFAHVEGANTVRLSPSVGYFINRFFELEGFLGLDYTEKDDDNLTSIIAGAGFSFNFIGEDSGGGPFLFLGGGLFNTSLDLAGSSASQTKPALFLGAGIRAVATDDRRVGFSLGYNYTRSSGINQHTISTQISYFFTQ